MTTPVGAIRLDLTVDGSGVWGDIERDVDGRALPTLAKLDAGLAATQGRYDALARSAEQAGLKQTAANKAAADSLQPTKQVAGYESIAKAARNAAEAIERIAAAEKLRDKGVADSAARVAAMDREAAAAQREARDMTELAGAAYAAALAVDKLAAANARAAVGPKPDYNRPNVPPSGGGGGRSGGGGLTGGGGFLGTLFSPVGVNAIALSTKAIAPMALGIAEVVRSAQDLVGVGALLPGLIAGIGASGGTAAIGLKGMGDAIGAMYKAAQEGASKSDLKKAAAAIKDLDSNAKEVAVTVASDLLPAFKKLQTDVVQHNMFDGIAAPLKDTTEKLLPSLKTGLGSVSSAWNGTFKTLLGTAGSDSTKGFLDRIFGNTAEAQTRANAAIAPLTHALGEAAAQGTNFLPRLADGLTAVTTRFDNFITKAIGDGRFDKWIDNGLKAVGDLGESFLNVGKILNDITGSLGGGQTFLGWLREATGQLHTFLSSADGQNKLSSFFQSAREEWSQIKPVLGDLAKIAGDVVAGFHDWGGVILPIVGDVAHALASMPQLIEGAVVAFAAFKTLSVFDGLLGGLGRVNSGLGETTTKAETLGARFGSLLKTAGLIAGVDLLSKGITGTPGDGKTSLQTIGGSAAIGFGVAGLPGAAVGAGVGIGADEIRRLRAIDNFNRDNAKAFDTPASQADEQARKALYALTFGPNGATKDTLSLFTDQSNIGGQTARQNLRDQVAAGQVNIPGVNAENFNTQFVAMIKNAQDAQAAVEKLGGDIQKLPDGKFQIVSPTDEEIKKITDLGLKVEHLPDGRFVVDADTTPADNKMKAFLDQWSNAIIQPKVLPPGGYTPGGGLASLLPSGAPGHAAGGVVPGYAPGVDSILSWVSPGEGVLIPEAVRGLGGPGAIYAINSSFRAGLSRRGYADGGVGPGGAVLPNVGVGSDNTVIGLLSQIRDLLAGRGGNTAPLNATADGITSLAGGVKGSRGGAVGGVQSGGKRNLLWDTAASFISMFGGDPYSILGPDPSGAGALGTAGGGRSNLIGPLSQFAHTGNFGSDLSALGLQPNSPVINAITAARDKKKGGLSDDQIGGLINQVLGTGTYTGSIDGSNKVLINSLLKLGGGQAQLPTAGRQELAPDGKALPTAPGLPGANIATAGAPIPVYIVSGPGATGTSTGGTGGFGDGAGSNIAAAGGDALTQAVGGALQQILPNVIDKTIDGILATGRTPGAKTVTNPDNPIAGIANLLGYKVTDFTKQGDPSAQDQLKNQGPGYDAAGRLASDTGALTDRTVTSLEAANEARQKQLMDALHQLANQLSEQVLKPIIQSAVTAAIQSANSAGSAAAQGHATGGVLPGYSPGRDNMLVPMSGGEGVLIPEAVRGLGGPRAIYAINSRYRAGLPTTNYGFSSGGIIGFADGGVNANATVGADFFGLSQVPIIGDLINMIVEIFLAVIGVQIKTRDTLTDMTKEIRGFRGDFKAFDASGRLNSDTSGLTARTQTSANIAEQQRMRVLKDVIIGALKFVIEDILIPLLKAAIQAAINFGQQAISSAIGAAASTFSFGAGGGVASGIANAAVGAIGSVAQAGADILLNILSSVLTNGAQVLVEALGNAITGLFPHILGNIAGLFSGIGSVITGVLKFVLNPFLLIGKAVGLFDEGGVASGIGMMPKGVAADELVLSPRSTAQYREMGDMLDTVKQLYLAGGDRRTVSISAPITVDNKDSATKIGNHLMDLAMVS